MNGPMAELDQSLLSKLAEASGVVQVGRVAEAYGTLIRATGINAKIGEICRLRDPKSIDQEQPLLAEVVGIVDGQTLLTPLGSIDGLSSATEVTATGARATVGVGEPLLGRILDASGEPIDRAGDLAGLSRRSIHADAPNPLTRRPVDRPFGSGVRAIDATLTLGEGQRVGIFAAAGGGKSTLLGMLARGADVDVNVIVLVGERGREVNEFIQDNLGPEGLARSVVVLATSDRPALERARAAYVGTTIAEYFRDQGQRVLLLMDSVTRFARALRDVGLSIGEPPTRRGFTPSVFSALPLLFERAGNNDKGSITAIYTVLKEDEETSDPIVEEVRSILDGHIVLSRQLAAANHYPAIDVGASASRVMNRVSDALHQAAAAKLRSCMAKYAEVELLVQLGEYKAGQDPDADMAIERIDAIRRLLQQPCEQQSVFEDSLTQLFEVCPA